MIYISVLPGCYTIPGLEGDEAVVVRLEEIERYKLLRSKRSTHILYCLIKMCARMVVHGRNLSEWTLYSRLCESLLTYIDMAFAYDYLCVDLYSLCLYVLCWDVFDLQRGEEGNRNVHWHFHSLCNLMFRYISLEIKVFTKLVTNIPS